jgi:hypothetical protein
MLVHKGLRIPPMQAPQSSSCRGRKPPAEMRSVRTSPLQSLLLGVTSCRRDLATSPLLPPRLLSSWGLANPRTQPASRLAPAPVSRVPPDRPPRWLGCHRALESPFPGRRNGSTVFCPITGGYSKETVGTIGPLVKAEQCSTALGRRHVNTHKQKRVLLDIYIYVRKNMHVYRDTCQ